MNKKLQKQIKAYAGFAGAFLACDKANGQVIYVDVNPDTLVTGYPLNSGVQHFLLDVDNDAINDFDFKVEFATFTNFGFDYSHKFILADPQNGNQIGNRFYSTGSFGGASFPAKLNYGDTIDPNGLWLNNPGQALINSFWMFSGTSWSAVNGEWNPGSDNYLTFRLVQNSHYYYGWLRMEIINYCTFFLKEYAHNTVPNVQLRAGHITASTGIGENLQQFNFSQQNNSIHISTFQNLNHANIFVYDLLGKEVLQQPFKGKETTIKIEKKGIYFVEVKSEKGVCRKKVFIY
jgi:hypothetical protein